MANFHFSVTALASLKSNARKVEQPSTGFGGTKLVDQTLAAAFHSAGDAGLTCKLIDYTCNEEATNRLRSTTTATGEKIVSVNAASVQQTGFATIETTINGAKTQFKDVKMHSVVALSFVDNAEQVLIGSIGEITSGKNGPKMVEGVQHPGKLWLSLRLPSAPSEAQILAWSDKVAAVAPIPAPQGA